MGAQSINCVALLFRSSSSVLVYVTLEKVNVKKIFTRIHFRSLVGIDEFSKMNVFQCSISL